MYWPCTYLAVGYLPPCDATVDDSVRRTKRRRRKRTDLRPLLRVLHLPVDHGCILLVRAVAPDYPGTVAWNVCRNAFCSAPVGRRRGSLARWVLPASVDSLARWVDRCCALLVLQRATYRAMYLTLKRQNNQRTTARIRGKPFPGSSPGLAEWLMQRPPLGGPSLTISVDDATGG